MRGDAELRIRLPHFLRDNLKEKAAANGRTMNAEIVSRLSGSGKTLLDEFAMAALPSIISATSAGQHKPDGLREGFTLIEAIVFDAYEFADTMMAIRDGGAS